MAAPPPSPIPRRRRTCDRCGRRYFRPGASRSGKQREQKRVSAPAASVRRIFRHLRRSDLPGSTPQSMHRRGRIARSEGTVNLVCDIIPHQYHLKQCLNVRSNMGLLPRVSLISTIGSPRRRSLPSTCVRGASPP